MKSLHGLWALLALLISISIFWAPNVGAEVPQVINYQGHLTDSAGTPLDTTIGMTFTIYDAATEGNNKWRETHTSVTVTNGLFSVLLGSVNPIADSIFGGADRWLGITPGFVPMDEAEITPRTCLASVPYAFHAGTVDSAIGGMIIGDLRVSGRLVLGTGDKTDVDGTILSPTGIVAIGKEVGGNFNKDIKVGIGTQSPLAHLHIEGFGTSNLLGLQAAASTGDNWISSYDELGNRRWLINMLDRSVNDNFQIFSEQVPGYVFSITPEGRVGIGTAFPQTELQVNGSISIYGLDGNTSLFLGQENVPSGVLGEWGIQYWEGGLNFWRPFGCSGNWGNNILFLSDNHNVGIGTKAPTQKFHVDNGDLLVEGVGSFQAGGDEARVFLGDNNHYIKAVNGSGVRIGTFGVGDAITILESSGKVGIGMNNPQYTLDVSGDIHASGTIHGTVAGTIDNADKVDGIHASATATANYLYPLDASAKIPNTRLYTGSGNGLDADKLDGSHASSFASTTHGHFHAFWNGSSSSSYGLRVDNSSGDGIWGISASGDGVYGSASGSSYAGVFGDNVYGYGVYADGDMRCNYDLYVDGDANITGYTWKGGGGFKIDHPLDPESKYLYHSFVESPDMMNVYNGNVMLDANGEATVELPDYFEAVNRDFRYQLTCIGGFAPIYVAEEISTNVFKIAGGNPGMKVSWQVTGIRKDAFAEADPIQAEVEKSDTERGKYLHPEAYGLGEEHGIHYEEHKRMREKHKEMKRQQEESGQ